MGSISGSLVAKCKKCKCQFQWYMDNMPFVDSEVIGTCDKCINEEDHDCYDELWEENGGFKKVGRKTFKKVEK